MDVDKLEAGPELDRRIHSEVFGGVIEHRWIRSCQDLYRTCLWCGGQFRDGTDEPKGCGAIPEYSIEIAAAWLVAEKVGLRVQPVLLPGKEGQHPTSGWMADDSSGDPPTQASVAYEAPLAICRAALKASEKP